VRYSLQMCSKLMFRDNFASLTATARQMADVDLGKAFDVSHEESENLQISRVSGCFYNSFFVKHGAPELTAPIFCKVASYAPATSPPVLTQPGASTPQY